MAHRPYPRRDRALAQLRRQNPKLRHRSEARQGLAPSSGVALESAGRILGEFVRAVSQRSHPDYPVDEYRLR